MIITAVPALTLPVTLPDNYVTSRDSLHLLAVHVMARARHDATGRLGLRPAPGGFATPAFGPDNRTLRAAEGRLLLEHTVGSEAHVEVVDLDGRTLREIVAALGIDLDLDRPFSVGHDTVPLPPDDHPMVVDGCSAVIIGSWLAMAAVAIDRVVGALPASSTPTVPQLWPEHFDLGLDVGIPGTSLDLTGVRRANLGCSLGDRYHAAPYAYVGPWDDARPGDPTFWNVPFGALLSYADVAMAADPVAEIESFMCRGLALLMT